jgi:hypothetical protein
MTFAGRTITTIFDTKLADYHLDATPGSAHLTPPQSKPPERILIDHSYHPRLAVQLLQPGVLYSEAHRPLKSPKSLINARPFELGLHVYAVRICGYLCRSGAMSFVYSDSEGEGKLSQG